MMTKKDKYGDYTISPFKKPIVKGGLKYQWFSYRNRGWWNRELRASHIDAFNRNRKPAYTIAEKTF